MTRLTPEAIEIVSEIANRYGVSRDAVETLLVAVAHGNGMQAQFNHFELGGMGQWSQGGMTMIGDMFNNGLKATVDSLCNELSQLVGGRNMFVPVPRTASSSQSQSSGTSLFVAGSGQPSWPAELGDPSSTGAQNNMRYGVFPDKRRLAVEIAGRMDVYDTGDHMISGFSQQQSGDQSMTFTSQYGLVKVADLTRVTDKQDAAPESETESQTSAEAPDSSAVADRPIPAASDRPAAPANETKSGTSDSAADSIISLIRKLADLKDGGILTEAEFETKKAELLSRL